MAEGKKARKVFLRDPMVEIPNTTVSRYRQLLASGEREDWSSEESDTSVSAAEFDSDSESLSDQSGFESSSTTLCKKVQPLYYIYSYF